MEWRSSLDAFSSISFITITSAMVRVGAVIPSEYFGGFFEDYKFDIYTFWVLGFGRLRNWTGLLFFIYFFSK